MTMMPNVNQVPYVPNGPCAVVTPANHDTVRYQGIDLKSIPYVRGRHRFEIDALCKARFGQGSISDSATPQGTKRVEKTQRYFPA